VRAGKERGQPPKYFGLEPLLKITKLNTPRSGAAQRQLMITTLYSSSSSSSFSSSDGH